MTNRPEKNNKAKEKVRTFKGAGLRSENMPQPGHSKHKWRNIRWTILLFFSFLFFASFYFDIQILEGSLSGSRLLGFHLIDPLAAVQVILSSKIIMVNLVIGVVTIFLIYLLFGGRSFCAWICPYHWLAELGEKIHLNLKKKKIIKNHTFDRRIRYLLYIFFIVLAWITGYTVFETINPVAILSRFIVYGPSLMLIWVAVLLIFEVSYSRRSWCRYFCPVGVSYQLIGLLSPLRVKWNKENCSNCKRCQTVCLVPHVLTNSINLGNSEYINGSDCTRCGLCVDVCDDEALSYGVKYLDKII
ncbi:Polyferredoxin NapH (periplasmic nitrate reductase) [Olavius algarvensis Delta 1 endosymbiont]|nr:Polyferredoxin NapH (periplasmic nitrate reductase) [Olavius algarvensis Delta 1 endosymbiont]